MRVFDPEKLKELEASIGETPVFPGKYETKYRVKQLFETGLEVTIKYVVRDGLFLYYDFKKEYK